MELLGVCATMDVCTEGRPNRTLPSLLARAVQTSNL